MITEYKIVEILKKNTQEYISDGENVVLTINSDNLKNLKQDLVKLLNLAIVTQHSELLSDFADHWNKNSYEFMNDFHISEYLKSLNCG